MFHLAGMLCMGDALNRRLAQACALESGSSLTLRWQVCACACVCVCRVRSNRHVHSVDSTPPDFCLWFWLNAENLGRLSRLAPGGQYAIPSFVADNKRQNKGCVSVLRAMCVSVVVVHSTLYLTVPYVCADAMRGPNSVVFGNKLKVWPVSHTCVGFVCLVNSKCAIALHLGCLVVAFPDSRTMTLQVRRMSECLLFRVVLLDSNASYVWFPLLCDRCTENLGRYSRLAPGGTYAVPGFVDHDRHHNKGVVFGHKTKTDDDIAKALGRYPRLAPGGSVRVESFAHDNKVQRRGVPFGHRLKSEMEMAQSLGRWSRLGPGGMYR